MGYTTKMLRDRLKEALDKAENGELIFITRRGKVFMLQEYRPEVTYTSDSGSTKMKVWVPGDNKGYRLKEVG